MDDRYTWKPGELTPVELLNKQYILMRHDPNGYNLHLLYEHSLVSEVVKFGGGTEGVDIVEVQGDSEGDARVLARFQLTRLKRGLEQRSDDVYPTLEMARAVAERVADFHGEIISFRQEKQEE